MRKALIAAAGLALVVASAAVAGNWATVKLSSPPRGMAADTPWIVDVTVLQHGLASQPLCCVKPTITIRLVRRCADAHVQAGEDRRRRSLR
jgi:hypothetical protein